MNLSTIKSPGVYINEIDEFGNSAVPAATAVPAFIGYTPQAMYQGKSHANIPTKITSFSEFQAIFMLPNPAAPADPAKQYNPQYYLVAAKSQSEKGAGILIDGTYYTIVPDAHTIYYLYNSIRLFYENGGADAYIVSVGNYGPASGNPMTAGDQIVNPNVQLKALTEGLALLKNEQEPTMYICPEATLLSVKNNGTLMASMLVQAEEMQTSVSIFDIIGGKNPDPMLWKDDIQAFRDHTGTKGLAYGTAYYPFVGTTIIQTSELDYTNLFGGDLKQLQALLSPADHPNAAVETILGNIQKPTDKPLTVRQYNNALLTASKTYRKSINQVLQDANILPPSGGIAGVITRTDTEVGPWKAPANTAIKGAISLPIKLSEAQQADLNVAAISGKSINPIRFFKGQGILIWGARTLDGNSPDWQQLSVRRTVNFLEQSAKIAAQAYLFAANDKNTWIAVKAMIGSFLTATWNEGGLQGATAASAYSVACGLGETMTSEDILAGFMRVTIKVAVVYPHEFITLTFQQQQATSR
jgi:phage tail sheath protein FI